MNQKLLWWGAAALAAAALWKLYEAAKGGPTQIGTQPAATPATVLTGAPVDPYDARLYRQGVTSVPGIPDWTG